MHYLIQYFCAAFSTNHQQTPFSAETITETAAQQEFIMQSMKKT